MPLESGVLLALLVFLTRTRAMSFPSGRPLSSERAVVHMLTPRTALEQLPWRDASAASERIGNIALLTRTDSESIGELLPPDYLGGCPKDALAQQAIPTDPRLWELHRYPDFCLARETALAQAVIDLLRSYGVP